MSTDRRESRRILHESRYRKALRLEARRRELSDLESASRQTVELAEPIRAGWERYFVVRQDLRRSAEGPFLERVLRLVQHWEVSNRYDFARRDWQRGNKLVPQEHRLGSIDAEDYWALTPKMREHFLPQIHRQRNYRTGPSRVYVTFTATQPWKFSSKIRPHYITHETVYAFDPTSEETFIDRKLHGPQRLARHLWRAYGCNERDPDYVKTQVVPLVESVSGRFVERARSADLAG